MSVNPQPKLAKHNQPESPTPDGVAAPNGATRMPDGLAPAAPAEEYGLTDGLEPLLDRLPGNAAEQVLDAIDSRAAVRITGEGVELSGLFGTKRIPFKRIKGIELSTRRGVLDQMIPYWRTLISFVPIARLGKLVRVATFAASRLQSSGPKRIDPDELDSPVVVRLRCVGPSVRIRGSIALVAALYPRMTERLLEEAERHSIPVVAYK